MNRKSKLMIFLAVNIMLSQYLLGTASANASWDYIVTRPVALLPIAIIITLVIETIGIIKFNSISKRLKAFFFVVFGNLVSFIAPQAINIIHIWNDTLKYTMNPLYTIILGYYLLTVFFEVPIIYFSLKKDVDNKKKLIITIFLVNLLTTLLVFALERAYMSLWSSYF